MPRAIWSGFISFGLVNVPVKVYSAVREHTVHFHQVEKGSGARIRYEKVSERSGHEVASKDIELGYELGRGRLVAVDPNELSELQPRTTKSIDISDFVDLAEIDPVFYNRTYWLGPDGESARRPYSLLLHAMEERQRAGIGMVVMRNKQYLAAIRPREGALAMSTMYFADEVVPRSSVDGIPSGGTGAPAAKELKLAGQIIDALRTEWDPGRYPDTYTNQVKQLIERQAEGKHIVVEEPAEKGEVLDLMAALEASLKAAGQAGGSRAAKARQMDKAAVEASEASDTPERRRGSAPARSTSAPKTGTRRQPPARSTSAPKTGTRRQPPARKSA